MMRFQEVMARFLDTQKSVMLGFLGTSGSASPPPTSSGHSGGNGRATSSAPLSHNGNGAIPPAMTPTNRIAAEHGGRVIPPPASSSPAPIKAAPVQEIAPTPVKKAAGVLDRETLLARLLDLVSERTGYPKEALSLDLDLEADLGVDCGKHRNR
jgi:hypothetical protein